MPPGSEHSTAASRTNASGHKLPALAVLLAILALLAFVIACAPEAPRSPTRTPLPTLAGPEDLSHQALAAALSELDYDLTQARSLLVFISKAQPVLSGSESECKTFVQGLLRTNPQYTQLGVAAPNGVLYCDSEERTRQFSIADRLYFSRVLSRHDFVVGEYVVGRVTLAPSMGLAYGIVDDSRNLRGIAIAPLRLTWLAGRFAEINIPVTGEIVIVDTYGNLLLRDPDATDWLGKNIADTPLGRAMLTNLQGAGDFAGADGETRYYSFASPKSSNKNLIVAVGIKR